MALFTFSILDRKHPSSANLDQKIMIVSFKWQLDSFEYPEFNDAVHFFYFRRETSFLGKFGLENKTCPFKVRFGA